MRVLLTALVLLWVPTTSRAEVVWTGIDYSMVQMYGTGDFNDPAAIFPGYLGKWNMLFVDEKIPALGLRYGTSVSTSLSHISAVNAKATTDQIIRDDFPSLKESHIDDAQIAAAVKGYELDVDEGFGVVLVADRLVKSAQIGCVFIVEYDIGSREVLSTQRTCEKAAGFGFRNYWFRPFKTALERIDRRTYRAWKDGRG